MPHCRLPGCVASAAAVGAPRPEADFSLQPADVQPAVVIRTVGVSPLGQREVFVGCELMDPR